MVMLHNSTGFRPEGVAQAWNHARHMQGINDMQAELHNQMIPIDRLKN
jgi:hypothetical protein